MSLVSHTVGYTIGAAGSLCGAFAAHAAWPETFSFLTGAGQAYPLQGFGGGVLTNVTSTLATIDPFILGGVAIAGLLLANWAIKSDHPAPTPS